MRLPHKGSSWDRVLIAALRFADQINRLAQEIESFAPDSCPASNLVSGQCLLLLEKVCMLIMISDVHSLFFFTKIQLGHGSAVALEKAFTLFY